MAFDLSVNVHSFPKCSRCGNDMALVLVSETETRIGEGKSGVFSSSPKSSGAEEDTDKAFFSWKCSCGNVITA